MVGQSLAHEGDKRKGLLRADLHQRPEETQQQHTPTHSLPAVVMTRSYIHLLLYSSNSKLCMFPLTLLTVTKSLKNSSEMLLADWV